MELLAPAGNIEKLRTAYTFGADAAYIGIGGYSLRAHADTIDDDFSPESVAELTMLKGTKRLYGALNAFMHNQDLRELPSLLELIAPLPLDALIVSDIGVVDLVKRTLPDVELHLSTQANCTNAEAARLYHRLGFSRVVTARELSLNEISEIKDAVPDLELEVFVHGAMCMSYSGRCFLSTHLADRSANRGDCAQPCRWKFAISEEKRPGEFFPVEEDGKMLTVLSSRDLMLFDHLQELSDAGVDAAKIEGRMKSSYYVAVVTSAYRAGIDALTDGRTVNAAINTTQPLEDAPPRPRDGIDPTAARQELFRISHREYTTGFLFGDESVHHHSTTINPQRFRMLAIVEEGTAPGIYRITTKNRIDSGQTVHAVRPFDSTVEIENVELFDEEGRPAAFAAHGRPFTMASPRPLPEGTIIRGSW